MGFLSGVLGAVKKDNNVKHYVKHIEPKLNDVISKLHDSVGKGASAFGPCLVEVGRWLRSYESHIKDRTGYINTRLISLSTDLATKYPSNLNNKISAPLTDQVRSWTSTVEAIETHGQTMEADVTTLNKELRGRLHGEVDAINKAIALLKNASLNENLQKQAKQVDGQMVAQKKHLVDAINTGSEYIMNTVEERFCEIEKYMGDIFNNKRDHFEVIRGKLADTQAFFGDEFDSNYRPTIVGKIDFIKNKISEFVNKESNTFLQTNFNTVLTKVTSLAKNVKDDLYALRAKIESEMKQRVKTKFNGIQSLENDVKMGLETLRSDIVSSLQRHVKFVLNKIETDLNVIKGQAGLEGFVNYVKHIYASGYKAGNDIGFEKIINEWIKTIVTHNEVIRGCIQQYVDYDKDNGTHLRTKYPGEDENGLNVKVRDQIAHAIMEELKSGSISISIPSVNTDVLSNDIKQNVEKVRNCVNTFAEELKKHITAEKVDTLADSIANDVEMHISKKSTAYPQLKYAVEYTLVALPSAARQAWEALGTLTGIDPANDDNIGKVDTAYGKAETLSSTLKTSYTGSNTGISSHSDTPVSKLDSSDALNLADYSVGNAIKAEVKNVIPENGNIIFASKMKKFDTTRSGLLGALESGFDDEVSSILTENIGLDADSITFKADFMKAFDEAEKSLQVAVGTLNAEIHALKEVPGNVETWKVEANTLMGMLRGELQGKLLNICIAVDECSDALDATMRTARNAISDAYKEILKVAKSVKSDLRSITDSAFDSVTTAVRSLFADARRADLQALKALVDEQKSKIADIIDDDLKTGIKGLMKALSGTRLMNSVKVKGNNTNLLDDLMKAAEGDDAKLSYASPKVHPYFTAVLMYAYYDIKRSFKTPRKSPPQDPYSPLVMKVRDTLELMLERIATHGYDYRFVEMLTKLESEYTMINPSSFSEISLPVLECVRAAVKRFAGEMDKAYVNAYSGQMFGGALTEYAGQLVTASSGPEDVYKLTGEGRRAAKIFLTIFNTIYEDIDKLRNRCEDDWGNKMLCLEQSNKDNPLGLFLQRCGYKVAEKQDSKDGELQLPVNDFKGMNIHEQLNHHKLSSGVVFKHLLVCESNHDEKTDGPRKNRDFDVCDILNCLLEHVHKYNDVCHLSTLTSKRQPCSVYEMLVWLSGLPHNPVHASELGVSILEYFEDPNKDKEETDGPVLITDVNPESLVRYAHPRNITWYGITEAIEHLCSKSYDVITAIAGTGDAETIYGSDLCNNSMKFHYPQSGEDCLQMIIDVLRRLFPPLRFLLTQCSVGASHNGWLRCTYGRDVQPATWPCKEHPSDKSKCQPTCQPNCQVNNQANCQPKSPLRSFLSDCHVGCLPHQLTSIGCKYDCKTCPSNKPGMPCLTPLGFRGFSGSMKTGRDISDVLTKFFGNPNISALICLSPTPPSTLPEHFTFTLSLVTGWNNSYLHEQMTLKNKVVTSIATESMDLYNSTSELTNAIDNAYGNCTNTGSECTDAHLISLTSSGTCNNKTLNCAPYLQSLCADSYNYLAYNNSKTYLTWALYLPWNFHKYLEALLTAFKDIFCSDWGCRSCLNGKCKKGEHGVLDNTCQCASMVKCSGVMPTLYRYGFAFQDAPTLDARKSAMKCFDFQTILFKVTRSNYFSKLFDECDNFLYQIRFPFMTLTLALWLLSLLYLLHIMVIRLDLLHIKSHLHSPSSHRIAAQSLLAAARVNKLGRVFYLQP